VRANPNARSSVGLAALLALGWLACSEPPESAPMTSGGKVPPAAHPRDVAVLVVKDFGEIRFELLSDLAPQTAAHFVALAERDFFDGTTFHRVVPGAMIQGGDPNSRDRDPRNDGMGGQSESVADERPGVSHRRGIVSLANRGVPHSAGSQFFIVVGDMPHLDAGYAAFGRVTAGLDVADRIAAVESDLYGRHGPMERPVRDVVISDVRIERSVLGAQAAAVP
jgi:peptidyl-prolyl cis-trans isomerase B (cyclophilin B)